MSGYDGTLDLTGANPEAVGFPPVPSGTYEGHVGKAEWKTTENIDGSKKLPHGTSYLSIGFRINDDVEAVDGVEVAGQYAGWVNLYIPPADYDKGKAQRMKNMMANFLVAIGEDISKKGYSIPETDTLVGTPVVAIVQKKRDPSRASGFTNDIQGFKPAGTAAESQGAGVGTGLR